MMLTGQVYLQADRRFEDMIVRGSSGAVTAVIPGVSKGAFQGYRGIEEKSRPGGEVKGVLMRIGQVCCGYPAILIAYLEEDICHFLRGKEIITDERAGAVKFLKFSILSERGAVKYTILVD